MYNIKKELKVNEHTKKLLNNFYEMAKEYSKTPIETIPYSVFASYYKDGNRIPYEEYYNERRRRLNVLYFSVLMGYTEFIPALEDMLGAICEEYAWSFPAHLPEDAEPRFQKERIDLFCAETAGTLAQIVYISGDILSKGICNRIRYEIETRIVPGVLNGLFPGVYAANWAAVCANGVMTALMLLDFDDVLEKTLPALTATLEKFLESYEEDGCCTEGRLYWSYGFGNFVYAADLLRQYTNGKIDFFKDEKVKTVAKYGFYTYLGENICLPYSDGPHRNSFNIGLFHFLKNEYPELPLPDEKYELVFDEDKRYRFSDFLRNLLWYDERLESSPVRSKIVDYYQTETYIRNMDNYSFSCKGGHNNEAHNHNDIGSFIVVSGGEFILDDLGWPEYDASYGGKTRYNNICASSKGHSLPIINGIGQSEGEEYRAEVMSVAENEITMDIGKAYEIEGLEILRRFELFENSVTITDKSNCKEAVTERFVTRTKPEIIGTSVKIGNAILEPITPVIPEISSQTFETRHVIESGVKPIETAYLIDFNYEKGGEYSFTLKLG